MLGILFIPTHSPVIASGDDDDYLAVSTSIAYGDFPYFANEYHAGEKMPFASIGPGVLASPFVWSFSLLDRWADNPIVKYRTKDNREFTWSVLGFRLAVYFYFLLGTFLLYKALKQWSSEFSATLAVLLIAIGGGGLLVYVFMRPIMPHVFEYFTVSLGIFLVSQRIGKFSSLLIGLCSAFICLSHYNNVFLALGFIVVYLYNQRKNNSSLTSRQYFALFSGFFLPILIFRVAPIFFNGYSYSDQSYGRAVNRILPSLDIHFYLSRLNDLFFGGDMGLIYTAPILLIGLLAVWLRRNAVPKEFLFLFLLSLINFYIVIMWGSFGSSYGYRYLFSGLPLVSIFLANYLDTLVVRLGKKWLILIAILILYIPFMSIFVFGTMPAYRLVPMITYGFDTYGNPTYHTHLLGDLIHQPLKLLMDILEFKYLLIREIPWNYWPQQLLIYFAVPLFFLLQKKLDATDVYNK